MMGVNFLLEWWKCSGTSEWWFSIAVNIPNIIDGEFCGVYVFGTRTQKNGRGRLHTSTHVDIRVYPVLSKK